MGLTYVLRTEIKRFIDVRILNEDVVLSTLDADISINNSLETLMNDSDADRAYIFRFHNGVKYYDGTHKSKMSCEYESTKKGISREAERLQDLPTALYADWILEVVNHKMYYYDISNIRGERVKQSLELQGIRGIAAAPYYRDGNLYAIIGVDYVRHITNEEVIDFYDNKDISIERFKSRVQDIGDLIP